MTNKDSEQDIKRFINLLDYDELVKLNEYIVKRLNLILNKRAMEKVQEFNVLDRVYFIDNDGNEITGTIIRLNQKTVTIKADDGKRWRVSPSFLIKDTG